MFQYLKTNHEEDVVEVQRRRKQEQQRREDEIRASNFRAGNERLRKQREARHNKDAEARAREFLERELQTQREMRENDARNNQQDFIAAHKEKDRGVLLDEQVYQTPSGIRHGLGEICRASILALESCGKGDEGSDVHSECVALPVQLCASTHLSDIQDLDDVMKDPSFNISDFIPPDGDTAFEIGVQGDIDRNALSEGESYRGVAGEGDNVPGENQPSEFRRQRHSQGDGKDERSTVITPDDARWKGKSVREIRRAKQKRTSKKRTMQRAKLALKAEQLGAMKWRPRRCVEIVPEIGMALPFRWHYEQLIRAQTAYVGIQKGVNISPTWERVCMTCRHSSCPSKIQFDWQPSTGLWKLNAYVSHREDCVGQDAG
ncbi:unnamed protein product [Agarophyton chilense]